MTSRIPGGFINGNSRKKLPVQRAVLDRLKHLVGEDFWSASKFVESAGNIENPVVGEG